MPRMGNGFIGIVLALLAWSLMLTTTSAEEPVPTILLTHAAEVPLGERAELAARVLSPEYLPLEGVEVEFTVDVEFQNTFDTVVVGRAITDGAGVARTIYTPRSTGASVLTARVVSPDNEDLVEASSTLTVLSGDHLFHPEDLIHDLRGRWDWLVQWGWLVILPGAAFAIYLFIMFLLWVIHMDGATVATAHRNSTLISSLLVPVGGAVVVLIAASVLIIAITLRPWASVDTGWRTELNLSHTVLEDYSRTASTTVDEDAVLQSWHPRSDFRSIADDMAFPRYVGRGCSSCHGLDLKGAVVGDDLTESSASDIRKALKKGPEGMPSYSFLTDAEFRELIILVTGKEPPAQLSALPNVKPSSTPIQSTPTAASTSEAIVTPTPDQAEATAIPAETPAPAREPEEDGPVSIMAATATMTVDGDISDWTEIPATTVKMQQIEPIPGEDMGELSPIDMDVRIAIDAEMLYLLLEIPDDYDFVADDSGLSASVAVMFRIDDPAAPHMGTTEGNQKKSLGKVDIWHWELDCGPGELSGGVTGAAGGNDPQCNFDDEYAETPEDLEDDGSRQAENTLAGVWEHTGRSQGAGADGVWIFEMSRPLQTGDPDDAQFEAGGKAAMALAYWDPDETIDGWTSEGHLQSSTGGWIEVTFP